MSVKKHSIPAAMQNAVCATARAADVGRARPLLTGKLAMSSACLTAALAFSAAMPANAQTEPAPATTTTAVPQNRATSADLDQAFKQTDANNDGKISREEAVNFPAVLQRFEAIDSDRDSFVSRAELGKAAGA